MFTDLSDRSYIDRRGHRKSPVSVYADDRDGQHISERKRGQRFSALTQSDGAVASTRPSGKAKSPRRCRQIRGYRCNRPRTIREFRYSRLSETALLSAGSYLRSAAHGWNPEASHPQEGQNAQVPANWPFFRILAQSPKIHVQNILAQILPSSHVGSSTDARLPTSARKRLVRSPQRASLHYPSRTEWQATGCHQPGHRGPPRAATGP